MSSALQLIHLVLKTVSVDATIFKGVTACMHIAGLGLWAFAIQVDLPVSPYGVQANQAACAMSGPKE